MTTYRPVPRSAELIAKAERIFRDELRQGCSDRLVQHGLEAFLNYWVEESGRSPEAAALAPRVEGVSSALRGYRDLSVAGRRAALQRALGLLNGRDGQNISDQPDPLKSDVLTPAVTPTIAGRKSSEPDRRFQLDAPLEQEPGVGPARARTLARLGLRTYGDLLRHYPNRYEPFPPPQPASELLFVQKASYVGIVKDIKTSVLNRGLRKVSAQLADPTGQVTANWLRGGFSGPKLQPGQRVAISGEVQAFGRQIVFENPEWEAADAVPTHTRRIVPVYALTSGIHQYWLRSRIRQVVTAEAPGLPDFLPQSARENAGLPELGWSTAQVHFPDTMESLEQGRGRLAFDELLLIQLVVLQRRLRWQAEAGQPLLTPSDALASLLGAQPFQLTGAQSRVIREISADLEQRVPMSRLLQGEVGSGKTAVAAVALFIAVANGGQGALMAPTEILAEQHYRTLTNFYGRASDSLIAAGYTSPRVGLLTGSSTKREKQAIYQALSEGEIDILVGTHAVIQAGVEPRRLALSVVDEQHRFGVRQRIGLRDKGHNPHLLVMTATPIPRTLALSLHGDLDLSLLDELPPGRKQIKTRLLRPAERAVAYEHVRREAAEGRQTFVICPLVEDSPNLEARAAIEEYERLKTGDLSDLRLGLLHGRMRAADKDEVMRRFRDRELDVLISTAVVEVGVDIPNATVMLIEGAERFGLAQLHQFRGRVGRGEHPATCCLLSDLENAEAIERLNMMVRSDNGLELAEYDLHQRGPGDFFGVRQSGLPELRVATLGDAHLVQQAREVAGEILAADPNLERPEHALLAGRLAEFVQRVGEPN